jgi:hypothetical protein
MQKSQGVNHALAFKFILKLNQNHVRSDCILKVKCCKAKMPDQLRSGFLVFRNIKNSIQLTIV